VTTFLIDVTTGTMELSVADIWPDGGAPEDPTAADVVATMREYGTVKRVVDEWWLDGDLTISVSRLGAPTDHAEFRHGDES
jgi:hypothetical protein